MASRIVIGADRNDPLYTFEGGEIRDCVCVLGSSLVGEELAIDQFMPVVYNASYVQVDFVPVGSDGLVTADGLDFQCYSGETGFLDTLPYGTPVWYLNGETLMGKFYSQRVLRTAKTYFDIIAVSAIGVLDGQDHNGGLYTGQTFQTVAAEIIAGQFKFTCAADVAGIQIFGWLPIGTRRTNLHQLLFACGVMLSKDANGDIYFRFPDAETYKHIPRGRIFLEGSIDYMTPVTRVDVVEHAFLALNTDQTVTLFDNTDGSGAADHTPVKFMQAPVRDLATTGSLTILESGVNYAIVSGTGTLTGRPYTHTTKVVSRSVSDSDHAQRTERFGVNTLVSIANSENVARRLLSYYSSARTVLSEIDLEDEKPGELISFHNPYDEPELAFLSAAEIRASSFLRASCEMVTGYVPSGQGNNYTEAVVLTGEGTYTFDADAEDAVAVLIQAGSGGDSGGRGTDAENNTALSYNAVPGVGGVPGKRGEGGKIYSVKLNSIGGATFAYKCGAPGVGGAADGTEASVPGTEGEETTFGSYTSASGERSETGYVNLFTGEVFALPGLDGVPGGDGCGPASTGTSISFGGKTWTPGRQGASYSTSAGSGNGGYGGGPAVGANGEGGSDGRANSNGGYGGAGGDGGTPVPGENAVSLGSGGSAGHGGGGGGNGGRGSGPEDKDRMSNGSPGDGAPGSNGANGAPGCIIIYLRRGGQ